jgi:carbamoylphosphate synthase large subunit
LPGDEYSVDLYVSPLKDFQIAVSRKRKKITSGICTEAQIEDPDNLKDLSIKIANHLMLSGNINMQFKRSVNGTFKLLEINPRLSGTVVGCKAAQIDFVKLMLSDRLIEQDFNQDDLNDKIAKAESNKSVMKRTYKEYFIVKNELKIVI